MALLVSLQEESSEEEDQTGLITPADTWVQLTVRTLTSFVWLKMWLRNIRSEVRLLTPPQPLLIPVVLTWPIKCRFLCNRHAQNTLFLIALDTIKVRFPLENLDQSSSTVWKFNFQSISRNQCFHTAENIYHLIFQPSSTIFLWKRSYVSCVFESIVTLTSNSRSAWEVWCLNRAFTAKRM